ncbi:hypothetical protein [Vibrio vulnificus]|uniref:hypothetical protein n=1 Tax=Vibrio vulnificus TaxID=672 RepID=UPI000DADB4F9|nr:hypothetical protein [Vibrio vulnificus]RAH17739.1 hypothetical protein DOT36_21470 [Vibrio vulnificus]HDY7708706.1 hypothetical protein [Vibrio vulnificus]
MSPAIVASLPSAFSEQVKVGQLSVLHRRVSWVMCAKSEPWRKAFSAVCIGNLTINSSRTANPWHFWYRLASVFTVARLSFVALAAA